MDYLNNRMKTTQRNTHKSAIDMNTYPVTLRRLSIRGFEKERRREIREAVEWMLPALIGKRLTGNVNLTIESVPTLGRFFGDCEWLDTNQSPREFKIRLSSLQTRKQQTSTLAHELTHLKQFVKNELFDYANNSDLSRWHNKKKGVFEIIDTKKISYWRLPWEREAYSMQTLLLHAYVKWTKTQNKEKRC